MTAGSKMLELMPQLNDYYNSVFFFSFSLCYSALSKVQHSIKSNIFI